MDQASRLNYALYPDALIDVLIKRRSCDSSMSLPLGSVRLSNEQIDLQKEGVLLTVPTLGPKILSISNSPLCVSSC